MQAVQSRPMPATCSGVDVSLGQGPPHRLAGGRPPLERLLLGPGRPGIGRLDRRDAEGDRSAVQVDQRRPQALGPDVQAQEQVAVDPRSFPWERTSCMRVDAGRSGILLRTACGYRAANVTGPSLTSSTFIMARKTPVATSRPDPAEQLGTSEIEPLGLGGLGRRGEAGPPAAPAVAQQRELADDQDAAPDVEDAPVHLARVVLERRAGSAPCRRSRRRRRRCRPGRRRARPASPARSGRRRLPSTSTDARLTRCSTARIRDRSRTTSAASISRIGAIDNAGSRLGPLACVWFWVARDAASC